MKISAVEQHLRPITLDMKEQNSGSSGETAPVSALLCSRLNDLRQMTSELITPYMTMSVDQLDSEIRNSIRRIVRLLGLDRAFLAQRSIAEKRMVCTHYYETPGSRPPVNQGEITVPPLIQEKMERRDCFSFFSLADLPEKARKAKAYFSSVGTKSHVSLPLDIDGEVIGCLSMESTLSEIAWPEEVFRTLKPIADVFALSIERKRRKLQFIEKIGFETLMGDLSARFVSLDAEEVDKEINQAFEIMGRLFSLDRCGLLEFLDDDKSVIITHAWYNEGREPLSGKSNLALLWPWSYERLFVHGEQVVVSSLADLPPEAAKDRETFKAMGVRSSLSIPLCIGRKIKFVIAFNTMDAQRQWPEDYIPRLRLMGEVLINALERKRNEQELKKSYEEIRELKDKLQVEADFLRSEIRSCSHSEEIIGQSEALSKVLTQAAQVAPTDSTVLICGETGTGKELVARAIHCMSLNRDKVMVKVNCASLAPTLVESELFGREKGAYTGALTRQIGRFELADGSTIFLDEITELSLELQAKLLRVLQEHTFERLGSPKTIRVNVRVIAATNRNIIDAVKKGKFRQDLYYRLNVFPITVLPLRDRVEDIPLLVWAFVNEFCDKMGKQILRIEKRGMEALKRYSWPGNIRELRNVIEHAVIVSPGSALELHLPDDEGDGVSWAQTLQEVECRHIMNVLEHTGGRIKGETGAARILGLIPSTLTSRMKKLGIRSHSEKEKGEISS